MSDKTDQILKKLDELIDLVKKNHSTVENHTHHHYPAQTYYPNWTYPTWYGSSSPNTSSGVAPGTTVSYTTGRDATSTYPNGGETV